MVGGVTPDPGVGSQGATGPRWAIVGRPKSGGKKIVSSDVASFSEIQFGSSFGANIQTTRKIGSVGANIQSTLKLAVLEEIFSRRAKFEDVQSTPVFEVLEEIQE